MGTNYYRVRKSHEVVERMQKLNMRIGEMDIWSASEAKNGFRRIPVTEHQYMNLWDEFVDDLSVHLGKRSSGWKFCWNFNDNVHYSNKEELLNFIRTGRIVDEYGTEINQEEDKTWIIDLDRNGASDEAYDAYINSVIFEAQKLIQETERDDSMNIIPTKNGLHLICRPFNLSEFRKSFPEIDVHKDNPVMLFCS